MNKKTGIITIILLLNLLFYCPFSLSQETFNEEFGKAITLEQLEALLKKYPNEGSKIIPQLESMLLNEIQSKGGGTRFSIDKLPISPEMMMAFVVYSNSFSIKDVETMMCVEYMQPVRVTFTSREEMKKDLSYNFLTSMAIDAVKDGKILFYGEFQDDKIQTCPWDASRFLPPLSYGSLHRIRGVVKIGQFTFINEGDEFNRLTFAWKRESYPGRWDKSGIANAGILPISVERTPAAETATSAFPHSPCSIKRYQD